MANRFFLIYPLDRVVPAVLKQASRFIPLQAGNALLMALIRQIDVILHYLFSIDYFLGILNCFDLT
ncbi:MAG: hypothetical protein C0490_25600 [Marivirga sp.]|nr:hypothetical protein [Marivirga sp.]